MSLKQEIHFCRSADNVRIAYAISGQGPPLVKAANYPTHLGHDWNSPVWRHWMRGLSETHRLIRYDACGSGRSDWCEYLPLILARNAADPLRTFFKWYTR
jgi:hypothetical protein